MSAESAIQYTEARGAIHARPVESRFQRWRFRSHNDLGRCPRLAMSAAPLALDSADEAELPRDLHSQTEFGNEENGQHCPWPHACARGHYRFSELALALRPRSDLTNPQLHTYALSSFVFLVRSNRHRHLRAHPPARGCAPNALSRGLALAIVLPKSDQETSRHDRQSVSDREHAPLQAAAVR